MSATSNVNEVRIAATARLHLGFLDLDGGVGRKFGGLGLSLSEPRTRLTLTRSSDNRVEGAEASRAASLLARAQAALAPNARHRLVVHEAIPAHAGLGSGTQLALSVAAAVRRLEDLPADADGDAALLDRGARSGLGAGLFRLGGFVVDGGRGAAQRPPPVVCRLPFPEDWRILLVSDPKAEGLAGDGEREAFAQLPAFSAIKAGEACRRVLMQALPALVEHDIAAFGEAIFAIQSIMGDHFAPAQGGRHFASAAVESAVARLVAAGAVGPGQSSWGPTGFAFVASEAEACAIRDRLRPELEAQGLRVDIASGFSRGAKIDAAYARVA
ncbi:MAG TPA: beta-ribofuranosylaminobenzene 5'-phosphate synthase family protein [Methylocystis sp.]|nr:beta-ribofuranosylaminobenzene 5'-phosphate synthase family protein [Methylocystis sp.]